MKSSDARARAREGGEEGEYDTFWTGRRGRGGVAGGVAAVGEVAGGVGGVRGARDARVVRYAFIRPTRGRRARGVDPAGWIIARGARRARGTRGAAAGRDVLVRRASRAVARRIRLRGVVAGGVRRRPGTRDARVDDTRSFVAHRVAVHVVSPPYTGSPAARVDPAGHATHAPLDTRWFVAHAAPALESA